ncbi:hypothetical protein SAMN05428959_103601 [Duganella sp. CF517]|uniref:hypothetical protein n=1 Tax=Duganella sp. CF517 TaxID=1881038 RepID=UPI0008CF8090|nr:hypothetical protein [Duganella sp. CF517]SEN88591.1 hypothetical protein SAMN05428959_103601 [Duganella sp. CF517]
MFNSETLEVCIGMIFLFLMMSLICTGIREYIEGILKWRAMDLERAVRTLLDDKDGALAQFFFSHPLISSLYQGQYDPARLTGSSVNRSIGGDGQSKHMPLAARRNLPSYIPAELFVKALIDVVGRGPVGAGEPVADESLTIGLLRKRAAALGSPVLQRVVLSAIDHSEGDLKQMTLNLQNWFDGSMDRASGWYKRRTQAVLFGLGLLTAVVMNVDALYVMGRLTTDKALRETIVTAAAKAPNPAEKDAAKLADDARDALAAVGMPMGWVASATSPNVFGYTPVQTCVTGKHTECGQPYNLMQLLIGWLITAIGVMLGAPFWFDVLNKFMVIRSTVKPHEKSPEEGSEDRKNTAAAPPAAALPAPTPAPVPADQAKPVEQPATGYPAEKSFVPHQWRDDAVNLKEITL